MTLNFSCIFRNIFIVLFFSLLLLQTKSSLKASMFIKASDPIASERQVILIDECGDLSEPDTLYQLTGNIISTLYTCFNIDAPNVSLDCQGYEVVSTMAGSDGVYIEADGASVSNCNFHNFNNGIYVRSVSDFVAEKNYIENAKYSGISLFYAPHSTIRENQIVDSSPGAMPLVVHNSSYSTIEKNRIEDNIVGVKIVGSSNTSVLGNTITCSYTDCLALSADNIIANNNVVSALGYSNAIALQGSYSELKGNMATSEFSIAIRVLGNYNLLENNYAYTNAALSPLVAGVYIGNFYGVGSNNVIKNNSIKAENAIGLFLTSGGNQVMNNKVLGNDALAISGYSGNIIMGNTFQALNSNTYGINMAGGPHQIYSNIIIGEKWIRNIGSTFYLSQGGKGNRYVLPNGTEAFQIYDLVDVTKDNQADMGSDYPLQVSNSNGRLVGVGQDHNPYTETEDPIFSDFRLEVFADPPSYGTVTGTNLSLNYGDVTMLRAVATPGYKFATWTNAIGNCPVSPGRKQTILYVTMTPQSGTRCLSYAHFELDN